jgi:hypothetical protein
MTCCGMMFRCEYNQMVLGNDVMNILLADELYPIRAQARKYCIVGGEKVSGISDLIGATHG